jgi:hypothetical protein
MDHTTNSPSDEPQIQNILESQEISKPGVVCGIPHVEK